MTALPFADGSFDIMTSAAAGRSIMNTMDEITRVSRRDVRQHARHQVMGLSAQFLLGMAISLIGQPSETTGAAHTASNVLLALHVLVAVILIAGAAGSSAPPVTVTGSGTWRAGAPPRSCSRSGPGSPR